MLKRYFVYSSQFGRGAVRMDTITGWLHDDIEPRTVDVQTVSGTHTLTPAEFDAILALADSDWWLLDLNKPPATGAVQ